MYKIIIALVVLVGALPAPVLAGAKIKSQPNNLQLVEKFESTPRSNTARKSKKQKCLDMMLPQDGADCFKKLKAKK